MYMTKYIIHIGICGFGNQLLGFKEACIIAKYTNRTIISPIFLPHGSIRNQCEEYYKFEDIFDYNLFKQSIQTATFDEIKNIPINRLGLPDDISNACVYLASEEASYITGSTLHINGGMSMI